MMDEERLREILEQSGALRHGHFRLSSGLHSDTYIQCAKLLEDTAVAVEVGSSLAGVVNGRVDKVFCPALGALVIGFTTALALEAPMVFAERTDGKMCLRRGLGIESGSRVLLVEDVITTGGSIMELARMAEESGAEVAGIACIVDRSEGLVSPYPLYRLARIKPETYRPDDCPLCRDDIPFDTPGTRFK